MTLQALATIEELQTRLKVTIDDEARAGAVLDDVSAHVRAYTGQQFTLGATTDLLARSRRGIVRLPQRPVHTVSAVTDTNDNPLLHTWYGDDRLQVSVNLPDAFAWEPWRQSPNLVKVSYEHGYDEIPAEIIGVVCQVAGRALGVAPEESGISQESIAGYSYSTGTAAAQGAFGLLPGEKAILDLHAHPHMAVIQVAP